MEHKFLNFVGVIAVALAAITGAYFISKEKVMDAGIKPANMDLTVRAGDDFFDYATRGWRNANPIPADYVRYGAFEVLNDTNLERVRKIAESDTGKIGTLYKMVMNEEKMNADGTAPVAPYMAEIDAIKSKSELPVYLGKMQTFATAFWGDGVSLDEMDSEHYIYVIGQGGIGLSRDYFFDTDDKTVDIRNKYRKFIATQLKNFKIDADADKIYALEERMAKSFFTKEKLRNPHANYHKISVEQLRTDFPNFDWDAYLTARGAAAAKNLNVAQPSAIAESIAIMNDTDIELIKDYLKYRIVASADSLLDETTYDITFDFYNRTMAGQIDKKPRWKRAVSLLDDTLGEEIGHLYVEKYFSADAKQRMELLVKNLQKSLGQKIQGAAWMSSETRGKALEKLGTFKAKIGYPEKWRDYSKLNIDANVSLWENMVRVSKFEDAFWLEKIGGKKDPTIWYMNAHEVNAYYDPSSNEICFPAGILQYPFFDMAADDAFNYGAIGSIIGHEMTHGYDDSGRHFDAHGNMKDWWTTADATAFDVRAAVMKHFFDAIEVAPNVHANGTFTLGENLADYGGVTVAFNAYKQFGTPTETVKGLTADQRFFIAYAGTWAGNIRDEAALKQTKTDEHSLARWRVNGILPHVDAWYDAFDIKSGDKLYLAPERRVKIW